jgi:methyl-accepting chemotaxis protein
MFGNMKIGTRLAVGFAVLVFFSVVIAGIAVWQLDKAAAGTREMMQEPLTKERLITDWARNIQSAVVRTTAIAKSSDPTLVSFFAKDAAASASATTAVMKEVESRISGEAEKALFAQVADIRKSYTRHRDDVMKLKADGHVDEANAKLEKEFIPTAATYQKLVSDILGMQRKALDEHALELDRTAQTSRTLLMSLAAAVTVLSAVFAWVLTRSITRPLHQAVALAGRVAAGDLTADIQARSRDETGLLIAALGDMNDKLAKLVSNVRGSVHNISTASQQIASGNADLSQRTEEQASSLEETASSMEELTSTVKQSAENARQANQLAAGASETAVKGGKVVGEVVSTMSGISESSKKIADITGVIDGIAFQTNILALNAAVEAARAGEQGRGFAVVASEVRTLAQRSAAAAKEIKALITDSVRKVEDGTELVNEAGKTMEEIVTAVKRVTDIIAEITAAAQEQSSGIEQVNQAVMQMDQVTQQNAALVEEAAAAADSMQQQAQVLSKAVAVFKVAEASRVATDRKTDPVQSHARVERRGPDRAKNVARLPQKPDTKVEGEVELRKTGTHDEWSEF